MNADNELTTAENEVIRIVSGQSMSVTAIPGPIMLEEEEDIAIYTSIHM